MRKNEMKNNFFQTEASIIKPANVSFGYIDSELFSKTLNISLGKNEKNVLDSLISIFTKTKKNEEKISSQSHDEIFGINTFLDIENLSKNKIVMEFVDVIQNAFNAQMNQQKKKSRCTITQKDYPK